MKIENTKAQMRKGILEYCILSILKDNEAYVAEILSVLKDAKLLVVEGTIYPLLTRLKNAGLLNYRWEESTSGPPRKYYGLTETGKLFLKELFSWHEIQTDPNFGNYRIRIDERGQADKIVLLDFGAVVEIEPGIEGMIHRSELSWIKNDVKPASVLSEGDVVDVSVLEVDADARRIRLSLKAVSENPWQAWLADHPIGTHVTGKIKNVTDFGFFVPVCDGMDGLVHLENLSWDKKGTEVLPDYSKGQEVEAVVLGVDVAQQRISLGIKQLSGDPFEIFLSGVKRGDSVNGIVSELNQGGAIIEVAEGVRAFLARREVPRDDADLKVGDAVEAKIIEVNAKRRQVSLSISQQLRDEERDAVRNYSQKNAAEATPSALALALQGLKLDQPADKPAVKKAAKSKKKA